MNSDNTLSELTKYSDISTIKGAGPKFEKPPRRDYEHPLGWSPVEHMSAEDKGKAAARIVNRLVTGNWSDLIRSWLKENDCSPGRPMPGFGRLVISWRPWWPDWVSPMQTIGGTNITIVSKSFLKETGSIRTIAEIFLHEWVHQVCGFGSHELFGSDVAERLQTKFRKPLNQKVQEWTEQKGVKKEKEESQFREKIRRLPAYYNMGSKPEEINNMKERIRKSHLKKMRDILGENWRR